MEIESYEPYHIGNKLNPATNFDSLKTKLKERLKTSGYSVPEKTFTEEHIILGLIETLGMKNGIRVEINHFAQALNVIGTIPERVTEIFTEVISILQGLGYELDTTSLFYEIIASVVIRSNGRPFNVLNRSANLNLEHLSEELNMNIVGIKIGNEKSEIGKSLTISIEPNATSPNSRFLVKINYRSRNISDIESFYRDLSTKISGLIDQMENV